MHYSGFVTINIACHSEIIFFAKLPNGKDSALFKLAGTCAI